MSNEPFTQPAGILIPKDALSRETLLGLIEEFVTREGTDYGHHDPQLSLKVQSVEALLESGDAVIVFDRESETTNILTPKAAAALIGPE